MRINKPCHSRTARSFTARTRFFTSLFCAARRGAAEVCCGAPLRTPLTMLGLAPSPTKKLEGARRLRQLVRLRRGGHIRNQTTTGRTRSQQSDGLPDVALGNNGGGPSGQTLMAAHPRRSGCSTRSPAPTKAVAGEAVRLLWRRECRARPSRPVRSRQWRGTLLGASTSSLPCSGGSASAASLAGGQLPRRRGARKACDLRRRALAPDATADGGDNHSQGGKAIRRRQGPHPAATARPRRRGARQGH